MRLFCLPVLFFVLVVPALAQSDTSSNPKPSGENSTPSESTQPHAAPPPSSDSAGPPDSTTLVPIKVQKANYPIEAQQAGLQGQVIVKILVSEKGDVEAVEVVSGDPILARAATDAVRKWKFETFIKGGKPVKTATKIPFDFAFNDKITDKSPPQVDGTAAKAGDEKPIPISQGVSVGMLIHKVQPVYPPAARSNHVQGTVLLKAVIGKDGRIEELTPVSGPPELIPSAVGAVQQWRYKPYLLDGNPMKVQTQITVIFQLSR